MPIIHSPHIGQPFQQRSLINSLPQNPTTRQIIWHPHPNRYSLPQVFYSHIPEQFPSAWPPKQAQVQNRNIPESSISENLPTVAMYTSPVKQPPAHGIGYSI